MTKYVKLEDLMNWLYGNAFVEPYDLIRTDAYLELPTIEIDDKK